MDFGDVDFMASMYNISPEMLLRILEKENLIYFNQFERKYYLNNDNRQTEGFLIKDDWDEWALSKIFLLKICCNYYSFLTIIPFSYYAMNLL